jgi:CHAT domain-containing protein/tetratricopeptide (TPR) repeat protein
MAGADEYMIREYLLGRLTEAEEEQVELRLLTEPAFAEEYDIVVDELTDSYIAGKFEGEDLKRVEEYFFKSAERRDKLKFALALKQRRSEMVTVKGHKRSFRPYLAIAASLLLLVGGFYVWRALSSRSEVDRGLAALQSAFREERPVEARISKFDYAPYLITRGPGTGKIDQDELRRAELTLLDAVKKNPTPAAHHALGKVFLAKRDFERAIEQFDEVLKGDPKNPQLHSDLGVAWLEKGKIDRNEPEGGKGLEELARSLEHLNKALELNPNLLEAIFNRAICRQYIGSRKQAEDDWRNYLAKDSKSPWAEEARRNLKVLEQQGNASPRNKEQLLSGFLEAFQNRDDETAWQLIGTSRDDLSGTNIFQQLLDAYLDHATNGQQSEAARELQKLSYVGEIAVRKGDEHYDADIATGVRMLSPKQLVTLVQARALMKTGYEMYAQSRLTEAVDVFEKAAKTFEQSSDHVEVSHARFWTAYSYVEGLDTQRGLAILTDLMRHCEQHNYRWLLMKTLQKTSSAKYNLKEYSNAIDYAIRALGLAQQMGDGIGTFDALDMLTELYRSINNYSQALNSIARSQPLLACCAFNPIKVWRHYAIVALAFHSAGLSAAAIDSQQEAVGRALATGETTMVCVSYAHLGLMYGRAGNYDEGLKNTQLAYNTAVAHSTEARGKEMMAYSSLQTGHLYRDEGRCVEALQKYDESIGLYESLKFPAQLYQAHKGRLVCYINEGKNSEASEEVNAVLALAERNRSTIFEGENRNRFFDIEQRVYDIGIAFAFEKLSDEQRAFAYSEDSRARSFLDLMLRARVVGRNGTGPVEDLGSRPLPWTEIKQRLPDKSQIIEYSVLADRTLIWVVNNEGLHVKETNITQASLEDKVRRYVNSITDPASQEDSAKQARELFHLLIEPVEGFLDRAKQLAIIPDKSLNELPFGALVSADNKYLVEDYCMTYSPSATVFILKSTQASGNVLNRPERLLSIGNPSFDRRAFPSLADLPAAEREARVIAGYYHESRMLLGPTARKRAVIDAMAGSDVVHFALHAVEDEHSETLSRLILAKDPDEIADDDVGALQACEIYGLKLQRTRLVVLSACRTGTGRYYRGEGTFSLARAFLVSGVPLVVSSLWPVDSQITADLMISFHNYRKQKHYTSARALQQAQLDILALPNDRLRQPYYWASFTAQGGYAKF